MDHWAASHTRLSRTGFLTIEVAASLTVDLTATRTFSGNSPRFFICLVYSPTARSSVSRWAVQNGSGSSSRESVSSCSRSPAWPSRRRGWIESRVTRARVSSSISGEALALGGAVPSNPESRDSCSEVMLGISSMSRESKGLPRYDIASERANLLSGFAGKGIGKYRQARGFSGKFSQESSGWMTVIRSRRHSFETMGFYEGGPPRHGHRSPSELAEEQWNWVLRGTYCDLPEIPEEPQPTRKDICVRSMKVALVPLADHPVTRRSP
jgi:hypothetical protein